jgi:hypothetical protein
MNEEKKERNRQSSENSAINVETIEILKSAFSGKVSTGATAGGIKNTPQKNEQEEGIAEDKKRMDKGNRENGERKI